MAVGFFVKADVVAAVNEEGTASPYPAGKCDGIVNSLVRVVGLGTQGIDNEGLRSF